MMCCTGQNNIRGDHRLLFGVEMSYKKVVSRPQSNLALPKSS
jgi:hypothetical protein